MNLLAATLLMLNPIETIAVDRVDVIEINKTTPLLSQRGLTTCSAKENEMAVESLAGEVWKDICGFEGLYQVSDKGRVRSLDRVMPSKRWGSQTFKGRLLTPMKTRQDPSGYDFVNLQKQGVFTYRLVHRLVAEAFIGPRPDGMEVNHKDGSKRSNTYSNLEYVTRQENIDHRDRLGLRVPAKGEKAGMSKLTDADVREIASLLSSETDKRIAVRYGVHHSSIHNIRRGKTWAHLTGILRGGSCAA